MEDCLSSLLVYLSSSLLEQHSQLVPHEDKLNCSSRIQYISYKAYLKILYITKRKLYTYEASTTNRQYRSQVTSICAG